MPSSKPFHMSDEEKRLTREWHFDEGSRACHGHAQQAVTEADSPDAVRGNVPLLPLARWVLKHCQFAGVLHAKTDADKADTEIAEWIAEEVAIVTAYTSAWRGSSTPEAVPDGNVADVVFVQAAQRVLPWPGISETPVPETSDGRIVMSHPSAFPTGCGDLRQLMSAAAVSSNSAAFSLGFCAVHHSLPSVYHQSTIGLPHSLPLQFCRR